MKFLLIFFISLILFQCSKEKLVYWCGDRECRNEKERIAYFKKNMVIEMKEASKKNEDEKIKSKKIKDKAKLEKKNKIKKEKELKKQAKINEKLTLEQTTGDEKKKKLFDSNVEDDNKIQSTKTKIIVKKRSVKIKNFDHIRKILINENNKKPFPDVNRVPE